MRNRFLTALAAACLWLNACASVQVFKTEGERIRAEGSAVYDEADPEGSRRAAIAAAQRNAVEQALGVFVSAQTRVRKAELLDSRIIAASAGFIKRYSVVAESNDGQTVKVSISAVVLLERVDSALAGLALDSPSARASVVVVGDVSGMVSQALLKGGFKIMPADASGIQGQEQALALARGAGADYLAYVQGSAYKLEGGDALGAGIYPYRARVSVRVAAVADGSIVADVSREAGGVDVAEAVAARKAQASAAEQAAQACVEPLALAAKSAVKSAQLRVTGLSGLAQLRDFRQLVSSMPAVDDCRLKSYGGGEALFALSVDSSDLEELAAAIMHASPLQLALISVNPYEVSLKAN